jgi:serine/threonine-protein kinase
VRFIGRGDSVITSFEVAAGLEVRVVPLPFDSLRPARVVLPRGAVDRQLSLSPDGRWLAYVSDEAGAREVYVQRFPGPGPRVQASTGSGAGPRWSPNGKELFYFIPGCCVVSATIATSPELAVVRRDSLFSVRGVRGTYDVTPDGKHFVLARDAGTTSAPIIVFGWGDEVREQLTRARAP